MAKARQIEPIGWVRSDFRQKFGIPRQSGLVQELEARVDCAMMQVSAAK